MKYLVDTDWIIDHLNGIEAVSKKLEKLAPSGICTSIILKDRFTKNYLIGIVDRL